VFLSLSLVLSVAPVFGSPIGIDNSAAPSAPESVLALPDVTAVNPKDLPDPVLVTCAQALRSDAAPPVADANSFRFDLRGSLIAAADLGSASSSAPDQESTPEEPSEMAPTNPGDGARLVAGLLNCDGSSAASGAVPAGDAPAPPRVSERLRAAVQAVAITASLVLLTGLGYIVALMTRRTSHGRLGPAAVLAHFLTNG
jgi:hypothetical protein